MPAGCINDLLIMPIEQKPRHPSDLEGWIGLVGELVSFLNFADADKNPDGSFVLTGNITSFLGMGEEFVVGADARYYWKGSPQPLAARLRETHLGLRIQVI